MRVTPQMEANAKKKKHNLQIKNLPKQKKNKKKN